jgi:NAD(P)-dependent dehydrogenase (short-subunit alcohol dehydrogenase family)
MTVKGKVIVVTGAFGALGGAVAEAAAKEEAFVAALDTAPAPPPGLAGRLGPQALILGGIDLVSSEAAGQAMGKVKAQFGRIDALFNIAGGFHWEKIADAPNDDAWDRMFAINLKTALNASRAALPHLLESGAGRIVNVGAEAASRAGEGMGAYAASKAAVHRLTESLAEELKLEGVTVNAVLPSTIDTLANRKEMPGADFSRWVAPADLAAVMLFLASDAAKGVTGALIPVSGKV